MNGIGTHRDRGEGPVSYLAAILLIGAILAVIAVSGVAAAVTTGTEDAICKVLAVGGLSDCEDQEHPPTAVSPSPSGTNPTGGPTDNPTGNPTDDPTGNPTDNPTGNPTDDPTGNPTGDPTGNPTDNPTSNPTGTPAGPSPSPSGSPSPSRGPSPSGTPTPTPTQPVQPVAKPEPICSGDRDGGYRDLTMIVPVRYVNVRGSVRVWYSVTKVIGKDGKVRWVVDVGGFGELGVAAPNLKFLKGAWLGGDGTGTQSFSFDNEKEARDFPAKYATALAKKSLEYNPAIRPLLNLPFVGGKLRKWLTGPPLKSPDKTGVEVGPAGGATPTIPIPGGVIDPSASSRFWSMGGVARDKEGNWILNLRDKGLTDPTIMVDLSKLPKQVAQRGASAMIAYLEKQGQSKFGPEFKVPPKLREYVSTAVKRGVKAGVTVELIGQNELQYTLDKHGNPIKFTRSTNLSWTARLRGNVSPVENVPITGQIPMPFASGGRTTTNYALDLRDPLNRAEATRLMAQGALTWKAGIGSAVGQLTPQGRKLDELFRKRGTVTELTYDESASGLSGGLESQGKRGEGALRVEGENAHSKLTGARIWRDGQGWVPWTECHR